MAARRAHAPNTEPQAVAVPASSLAQAPSPVRIASDEAAIPSPARALQAELEASWREEDRLTPIPGRWSGRKTMAFVVGTSTLLWVAIIGGVGYLIAN